MFNVGVEISFSAAHCHGGADADCARIHGHNYRVEVVAESGRLRSGMVADFRLLRAAALEVVKTWDHRLLNELEEFRRREPTTEEIARRFCQRLAKLLKGKPFRIREIRVWETEKCWASYRP